MSPLKSGNREHQSAQVAWLCRTIDAWNERAGEWNASSTESARSPERLDDIAKLVRTLELGPGTRVLDAGCGTGQWAIAIALHGSVVTGIDVSPRMVALASANARAARISMYWVVGDIAELPFGNCQFDAVLSRVVLHFSSDVVGALNELRRVLRPEGKLFVSGPGSLSPIYARSADRFLNTGSQTMNLIQPWELEYLLTNLGWVILDQWGDYGSTFSGTENEFSGAEVDQLPLRIKQAASTTWSFIARNE